MNKVSSHSRNVLQSLEFNETIIYSTVRSGHVKRETSCSMAWSYVRRMQPFSAQVLKKMQHILMKMPVCWQTKWQGEMRVVLSHSCLEQAKPNNAGSFSGIHLRLSWCCADLGCNDWHKPCLLPSLVSLTPPMLLQLWMLEQKSGPGIQESGPRVPLLACSLGAAYPCLTCCFLNLPRACQNVASPVLFWTLVQPKFWPYWYLPHCWLGNTHSWKSGMLYS